MLFFIFGRCPKNCSIARTKNYFARLLQPPSSSYASYTANPPHRYLPLLLALHVQTASLLFKTKYPITVFFSPAIPGPIHHLRTHPLLLPLPLISQFLFLLRNPQFTQSFPTVQTSNPIQIPSPYNWLYSQIYFLLTFLCLWGLDQHGEKQNGRDDGLKDAEWAVSFEVTKTEITI